MPARGRGRGRGGRRPGRGKAEGRGPKQNDQRGGGIALPSAASASLAAIMEPWMPVFPARVAKKLRYSTSFQLTSTSGAVASYVFRANDLYDPDVTSTGHQPMGFDQLCPGWYNHFCVTHALIKVIFRNSSSAGGNCCIRVDGDATPLTVIDRIVEIGGNAMDTMGNLASANDTKRLSLGANIPKLQGVSPSAITADPSLQGSSIASPVELTYFHVQTWSTFGVTTVVNCDVVIEYTAWFLEPRDMALSLRTQMREEEKEEKKTPAQVLGPPILHLREQPELALRGDGRTHQQQEIGYVNVQPTPMGYWVPQAGPSEAAILAETLLSGQACGRSIDELELAASLRQGDEMALCDLENYYHQLALERLSLTGAD